MRIRTMKVAAVLAAAALWMCIATPQAEAAKCKTASCIKSATSKTSSAPMALSKFTKRKHQETRGRVKAAHPKSGHLKRGAKLADAVSRGKARTQDSHTGAPRISALPASVANARAELTAADPAKSAHDEAQNIAATDDNEVVTMNGVQIAAADQLNDIDRTAADDKAAEKPDGAAPENAAVPLATPPVATPASSGRILRPVPSGERFVVTGHDEGTWSKTSLIGKIFVAFGSLLTLVSAARLIIA